ncbi:hypothetical protein HMN09_00967400 [Mycena chlorophos]|uniref:C2H2-type domain-containing protein n=1 Tax=Mycena chlorophos TaxID=658473 RepID=A0A8H6SKQ7_MYCCL|nr:hypothetical protein HMN09_00967400 [Mycena chlorophos]
MAMPPARRESLNGLYERLRKTDEEYDPIKEAGSIFDDEDNNNTNEHKGKAVVVELQQRVFDLVVVDAALRRESFPRYISQRDARRRRRDGNSDVEPMELGPSLVIVQEPTSILHREQSPEITNPIEDLVPLKPKPRRMVTPPRLLLAPESPPRTLKTSHVRGRLARRVAAAMYDDDDEGSDDASGDEYVPSPPLLPRKRPRSASPTTRLPLAPYRAYSEETLSAPVITSYSSSLSSSSSASASSSSPARPAKRARPAPASRNLQTTISEVQQAEASDAFAEFRCTVCGWVQHNRRVPDFKRHVKTHQREADDRAHRGWCCVGVPADEAREYGVPSGAEVYMYLGERRVGGCLKTFSRRDALKRHLGNMSCISEILAPDGA